MRYYNINMDTFIKFSFLLKGGVMFSRVNRRPRPKSVYRSFARAPGAITFLEHKV